MSVRVANPQLSAVTPVDLKQPELYINREISLLAFHRRVLEQAKHLDTPLLERLKFLCISCTNLDEFFEIRVSGLKELVKLGSVQVGPDQMTPQEIFKAVHRDAQELVAEQYRVLNEELIPAMEKENIRFIRRQDWNEREEKWLRQYFEEQVLPLLSPMGLDSAHPFPRILNKSLAFIVSLKGKDAFGRSGNVAVVQAPRALPRLIKLPPDATGAGPYDFVFLSSIIHTYVDRLFPSMKVTGCFQFRVTRNSDLFVDEEEIDDLLRALEGELLSRRYGDAVRLEAAENCPDDMVSYLLSRFQLTDEDLYSVDGPVNLNRLLSVYDMVDRPDLKYAPFTPGIPQQIGPQTDFFEIIRKQDILLHHPFESFAPVVDFVRQAAADPQVLAIKATLYRTGPDSAIVDRLAAAARAGKEVTVVIELRARFDEEANISLANRLQEAGAHVVYGIVGYKTHAKLLLVVRREGRELRDYVHMGTGNYHSRTARLYTDYGLFTCEQSVGEDAHKIFLELTSLGKVPKLAKLLEAPFSLHAGLIDKIERERRHAERGRQAHIIAKLNSLIEPQIIQALYNASRSGVHIDLLVRGMCSLRPGIEGVSDNITVRSIVGRFLEHTRVFYFRNAGKHELYCSSADWMQRNFFRRVELCFPIESKRLRERVQAELQHYLEDNTDAWIMQPDGSYVRSKPGKDEAPVCAQSTLLEELAESS